MTPVIANVVALVHEALRGGIQKSILKDFRKRGRFSPNVDKNEEMAPRTRTGYPHEGPFVGRCPTRASTSSPHPNEFGVWGHPHTPGPKL